MEGSETQLSYGFESAEGIPGTAQTFLEFESETLAPERPPEMNPNMDPSNLDTEPRNLAARGGGSLKLAPDVNSILRARVQHRGYATPSSLVAAVTVAAPTAPTATAVLTAGLVDVGSHTYKTTFKSAAGETAGSVASGAAVSDGTHGQNALTNIEVGPAGTTARYIYRNKVADATHWFLQQIVAGNAATVGVDDNTADSALGAAMPTATLVTSPEVTRWLIRNRERSDSAMSRYIDSLFFNIDRADGNPHLVTGAKCVAATWKITENKFVSFEQSYLFARETELGDPVPDVGNNAAFTGSVIVRGMRSDPEAVTPLHVTVLAGGALDGTATVRFTLDAGVAAGAGYAVVSGQPIQVILGAGEDPGNPSSGEMVEVIFVGNPSDVLTTGDTWEIPNVRTTSVPIFSTSRSLTAVGGRGLITLNGVQREYALHDATVVYTRPLKLNSGIGRKYAFGVITNGKETCTVTLARDFTDLDFYRALALERPASFQFPMVGDVIRTGFRERWVLDIKNAKVPRAGATATTATALPETIELRAFRPAASTDPLLLETLDNTISAL